MYSNDTMVLLWSCLHSTNLISWDLSCVLSRFSGACILSISILCLKLNVQFLCRKRHRNSLIVSLFTSSILVITVSVPIILVQLFTCRRHCAKTYCSMEGFISYLSGCLSIFVSMTLSVHRYLSLCSYNNVLSCQSLTIISWLLSVAFTFPLIFHYFNSYVPEGLGFHCSINWKDQSYVGRLYIFSSLIIMYLIPLLLLIFVNMRSHAIIRRFCSQNSFHLIFLDYIKERNSSRRYEKAVYFKKEKIYISHRRQSAHLKRLRTDYRFLRAIVLLVMAYVIAWTPYSIVAVLQMLNVKFISEHAGIITISAFAAKMSVILTPFFYISVMNNSSLKRILYK